MTDDPNAPDAPETKSKKRGFFSRLFKRGEERPETPETPETEAREAGAPAEAPEVRHDQTPDTAPHDQPAEGTPDLPEAEPEPEPEPEPEGRRLLDMEPAAPPVAPREAPEAAEPPAGEVARRVGEGIEAAAARAEAEEEPGPDAVEEPLPHAPAPAPDAFQGYDAAPARPAEGEPDADETAALEDEAEQDRAAAIAEAEAVPAPPSDEPQRQKKSWFARLRDGLSRSSSKLTEGITGLFTKRRLDDEALEDLEDLLITADLGVSTSAKLVASLAKERFGKDITGEEIRKAFAEDIAEILEPVARPLEIDRALKPHVVLVVGVNGSGKTTTIGKMARQYQEQGLSVMLAAGDTFRAAAVEQLKVWGDRTNTPVISRDTGADAAGLAYDAYQEALKAGTDVLMIDTAGRLQNKKGLMDELQKIVRVLKKIDPAAPHSTLLVLDATVGQNAHNQVEVFKDMVNVTGLVMTKLDGTAKGGVVVALADKFGLPVHSIGVGETAEDLRPFKAEDFARGLMGV
ncbi:signal recognition particle-docking protein FtsY [Caenispirillum salinarum]|uniref:signal recognition particle-docking protein FtsY n=1 Tax=Caenispirillum salinarum TaxID=859058 RepID=UPI00384CB0E7